MLIYILLLVNSLLLVSCTGDSSNSSSSGANPQLQLVTPSDYPAGVKQRAYVTVRNTSTKDVSGVHYIIPRVTNYTNASLQLVNDGKDCSVIKAAASCAIAVEIPADAHTGSFDVVAIDNEHQLNNISATVGLTALPENHQVGADGVTLLYPEDVSLNIDMDTEISITAITNSNYIGDFDTIRLTNNQGEALDYELLSTSTVGANSVSTLLLKIPTGSSGSYSFYVQLLKNGVVQSISSNPNLINLIDLKQPIIHVSPKNFVLSTTSDYTEQVVTYTNIGRGAIDSLDISFVDPNDSNISMVSNNCNMHLDTNTSCVLIVRSSAGSGISGTNALIAKYGNQAVVSKFSYNGQQPIVGLKAEALNNFNFIATNADGLASTQVTLRNTGNLSESTFSISFTNPELFKISTKPSDTCILHDNLILNKLDVSDSCTFTLTYINPIVGNGIANMNISYEYLGIKVASPQIIPITYQTVDITANLSINPSSYDFGTVIANNQDKVEQVFTITNNGTDSASDIAIQPIIGASQYFSIIPQVDNSDDCANKITLTKNSSCTIKVRFGMINQESSIVKAVLPIKYKSNQLGTLHTTIANLSGSARHPLSANPILSQIRVIGSVDGNGESLATSIQVDAKDALNSKLELIYTNDSNTIARDFSINDVPSGYTILANTCNKINLESNQANSCIVRVMPNSTVVGTRNILLTSSSLDASFSDESMSYTHQVIHWSHNLQMQNIIYINIFQTLSVNAIMSSDISGLNPITQIKTNESFYIIFKLSGGYNVNDVNYTLTLPNGFSAAGNSCTLNQQVATCNINITAPTESSLNNIININGNYPIAPNSFTLDVLEPYYLFVTKTYNGMLYGVTGADFICQTSSNKPLDSKRVYKAAIYRTDEFKNIFVNNQVYTLWYDNKRQDLWTPLTTSFTSIESNSLVQMVRQTIKYVPNATIGIWLGDEQNNCQDWYSDRSLNRGGYLEVTTDSVFKQKNTSCELGNYDHNVGLGLAIVCVAQ